MNTSVATGSKGEFVCEFGLNGSRKKVYAAREAGYLDECASLSRKRGEEGMNCQQGRWEEEKQTGNGGS